MIGDEGRVNKRKSKPCYIFRSNDFPSHELYTTKTHFIISTAGHVEEYFDFPAMPTATATTTYAAIAITRRD